METVRGLKSECSRQFDTLLLIMLMMIMIMGAITGDKKRTRSTAILMAKPPA